MIKFAPVLAILLAAGPVLAQGADMRSPPTPNAASAAPAPANSMPPGTSNLNPGSVANPNVSGPVGSTDTSTGMPASPVAPNNQPGSAFQNTVPTPAVK